MSKIPSLASLPLRLLLLLLRLLHALREDVHDLTTLVVSAGWTNTVRPNSLPALRAGAKGLFGEGQVRAAAELLALGHVMPWNSHGRSMITRKDFCRKS